MKKSKEEQAAKAAAEAAEAAERAKLEGDLPATPPAVSFTGTRVSETPSSKWVVRVQLVFLMNDTSFFDQNDQNVRNLSKNIINVRPASRLLQRVFSVCHNPQSMVRVIIVSGLKHLVLSLSVGWARAAEQQAREEAAARAAAEAAAEEEALLAAAAAIKAAARAGSPFPTPL